MLTICAGSANRVDSSHPFLVHMLARGPKTLPSCKESVIGIQDYSTRLVFLKRFQPVEDLVKGQVIGHL